MKCNICHKEFGEGVSCQHCGVDRVTALGNYQGYSPNAKATDIDSNKVQSVGIAPKELEVCYACSEVIPAGSEYCPCCGKKLFENCPKCGNKYSSRYAICPHCGTNRIDYNAQIEKGRREQIEKAKRLAEEKRKEELRQAKINAEQEKKRQENQRKEEVRKRGIQKRIQAIKTKSNIKLFAYEIEEERGMERVIANAVMSDLLKEADAIGQDKTINGCFIQIMTAGGISLFLFLCLIAAGVNSKSSGIAFVILIITFFYKYLTFANFKESDKEKQNTRHLIDYYKRTNPNDPVSKYLSL